MIPEMRVGDEAMRRLWLVVVGVDGVLVPVPALDSDVLTAGVREESPRPAEDTGRGGQLQRPFQASSSLHKLPRGDYMRVRVCVRGLTHGRTKLGW